MPTYVYKAYTATGKRVSGRQQALNPQELESRLEKGGMSVRAGTVREVRGWRSPYRWKLSTDEVIDIYEQLGVQLKAQVLANQALESMIKGAPNKRVKAVLNEILQQVVSAKMKLGEAFELFPRSFPPHFVSVIRAGEAAGGGNLGLRFGTLCQRLKFWRRMRRIFFNGIEYPLIVVALALVLVGFFLVKVVPVLEDTLKSTGKQLPPSTQHIVDASHLLIHGWPMLVGGAVVIFALATWFYSRPAIRLAVDMAFLRLPYFGKLYQSMATATVFKEFAESAFCGVLVPQNLADCALQVRNREMRRALYQAREDVMKGMKLYQALKRTGYIPPNAWALVKSGEETGKLGENMLLAAEHHAERAEEQIEKAVRRSQPLAMIAIGCGVAYVAVAFATPMYQVASAGPGY